MSTLLSKINEFQKLVEQLKAINDTLNEFELVDSNKNEIEYGCRVQLTRFDGEKIEGRVWGINKYGEAQVNRDGYASYMDCNPSELKNLSVGTIGKLEKEKWIREQKISALKKEISEVNYNFIELGLPVIPQKTSLEIEILSNNTISNTNSKLIALRKKGSNDIRKIVSSYLDLEPGIYLFEFLHGFPINVAKI
jgi:hypothetical protein